MITPIYCQVMAAYGRHMNEQLLSLAAPLPDEERRRDRGAFFRSIYQTLEHVLFADRAWMTRLTDRDYRQGAKIGDPVAATFEELWAARRAFDLIMSDWAVSVDQTWLDGDLTWVSGVDGKTRTTPRSLAVTHMFNHGTHHRGQITTMFSQMGIDPGVTDMAFIEPVSALATSLMDAASVKG